MTEKWEFLQLFGCVDNGRILYKDLIICREAAYLNNTMHSDGQGLGVYSFYQIVCFICHFQRNFSQARW
jgi:hypothetical protein